MIWFLTFIAVLANYRLSRLVVYDDIFEEPRDWVLDKLATGYDPTCDCRRVLEEGKHAAFDDLAWWRRKLIKLIGCPWCVSAYPSLVMTIVLSQWYSIPVPFLWWLAVWGATMPIFEYTDGE